MIFTLLGILCMVFGSSNLITIPLVFNRTGAPGVLLNAIGATAFFSLAALCFGWL